MITSRILKCTASSRRYPTNSMRQSLGISWDIHNNDSNKTTSTLPQQHRNYHATTKKEVLPIVAAGALLFIGRYSWKALQRMDEEWEEYQWELQQYEKAHRNDIVNKNNPYQDGTLALDVGTMYIKLAHNGNGILATREGTRSTFAGKVKTSDDDGEALLGQQAYQKYWEAKPSQVEMARKANHSSSQDAETLLQVITPAIQDALERANLDQSRMRSVITVPASSVKDAQDPRNVWNQVDHEEIWNKAEWIPEPVAAVWGAQVHKDLPLHDLKKPVLVVDIGAYQTSLSIVEKDLVTANVTLDFGAQTYVDATCDYVVESQKGLENVRNDGMAWQRLMMAAHDAVREFNTNSQAQLNIPYIGMDLESREPIHLDLRLPRQLIEQKVADTIVTDMILKHENGSSSSILSPHVPVSPHNLSSLWMSLMTQLLTELNQQPQDLGHVLVVGGGAKHNLMEKSLKECFGFFDIEVVLPELSTRSELVALGASSILPQYEYNLDLGLMRLEDADTQT